MNKLSKQPLGDALKSFVAPFRYDGTGAVGWDNLVYGVLLVVFIIFLPKGILGSVMDRFKTQPKKSGEQKPVAS